MSTLRDYQANAIQLLRQGFRNGHRCQVLQMATGSGKTQVASHLLHGAVSKGRKSYFIVDRLALVNQAAETFYNHGLHVGIVQGDHPGYDPDASVQVATVQTLARRPMPDMGFAIIDECHCLHQHHIRLMQQYDSVPFIGLSATPWAKGLGKHFSNLVLGADTKTLIERGYLVPYRAYAPHDPDLSGVKTQAGDYQKSGLAEAMDRPSLTGDIVEHWLKYGENRQTLIFAVNIGHSNHLAQEFNRRGIPTEHVDAYTDIGDRHESIRRFKAGEIKCLSSVSCLSTGFDAPNAACAIIARPTKSLMLHIQMIGRVLRTCESKQDALLLDHAGNTLRLGLPDDPMPTELDDGNRKPNSRKTPTERTEPLPSACPSCNYLKPAKTRLCPCCGFEPKKMHVVETEPGELVQISGKQLNKETPWSVKIRWAAGLKYIELERGYKSGWWARQYREKYSVWPNDRRLREAPASLPDEDVRRFVKHQMIKFARSRKAA